MVAVLVCAKGLIVGIRIFVCRLEIQRLGLRARKDRTAAMAEANIIVDFFILSKQFNR